MITPRSARVGIIGAGMSGICMAAMLQDAGITNITILEKATDVGGTWRDNTYPGLSCDVPSRAYQFSFAMKPDWSRFYSPGGEIHEYFRSVADDRGIAKLVRFNTEVTRAVFSDHRWHVTTDAEDELTFDFLVSATGILHHPRYPTIAGLDEFDGAVFHSARWDHSVSTDGRRVAVIGTGSTGVQIVVGLADTVGRLEMFQRTAQWVVPFKNKDYKPLTMKAHARFPRLSRLAYDQISRQLEFFAKALIRPGWRRSLLTKACKDNLATVVDPELRRKLTPDFEPMCKRLIISSEFYNAVQKPSVEIVTDAIDHVDPTGIVTADGAHHDADVIVLATGFDTHAFVRPVELIGAGGLSLEQLWADGPHAYLTVALPHFPNFFMLMGPHSPVGNYSLTRIAEAQGAHIRDWILSWQCGDFDSVAPTAKATRAFNLAIRAAMPGTIWTSGCDSWYLGKDGLPELWPWTPSAHRDRLLSPPKRSDYELRFGATEFA